MVGYNSIFLKGKYTQCESYAEEPIKPGHLVEYLPNGNLIKCKNKNSLVKVALVNVLLSKTIRDEYLINDIVFFGTFVNGSIVRMRVLPLANKINYLDPLEIYNGTVQKATNGSIIGYANENLDNSLSAKEQLLSVVIFDGTIKKINSLPIEFLGNKLYEYIHTKKGNVYKW